MSGSTTSRPARPGLSAPYEDQSLARRLDPGSQWAAAVTDGGRWAKLARIFSNPKLPSIDDYYEPWTYDYENLTSTPLVNTCPSRSAQPHSISGEADEGLVVGQLGRRPRRLAADRAADP